MKKPTSPLQSCRSRTEFATLVPAPELSLSDAKNNPYRKMRDTLYRERQLWRGNESVEIWYVSGSSVAGTSASSPGVPRHVLLMKLSFGGIISKSIFLFVTCLLLICLCTAQVDSA